MDGRDASILDSVDFMNFVVGLHGALDRRCNRKGDYDKLASLDGCVAYLTENRSE